MGESMDDKDDGEAEAIEEADEDLSRYWLSGGR